MKTLYRLPQPLLLFLLLLCGTTIKAQFPGWQWAKPISGDQKRPKITAMCNDKIGNVYVTGDFSGYSVNLGTSNLYNTNASKSEIFLAKYDTFGNLLWAISEGGTQNDFSTGIAIDPFGNIVLTGHFHGFSTIGNLPLTDTDPNDGITEVDFFIAKYDPSGNALWVTKGYGSYTEKITSVKTEMNGNITVSGVFESPTLSLGNTVLTNSGMTDVFIARYGPSGNLLWANQASGDNVDLSTGLALDAQGNAYLTGDFRSALLNVGTISISRSNPGFTEARDMFLIKYNLYGSVQWIKKSAGTPTSNNLVYCDAFGNVIVAGNYLYPINLDNNYLYPPHNFVGDNIYLVKYDVSGNYLWSKNAAPLTSISDIAGDSEGNIYLAGTNYADFTDFATVGDFTLYNQGAWDAFVARYNTMGNASWAILAGGDGFDGTNKISMDVFGNLFLAGFYEGAVDFGAVRLNGIDMGFLSKIGNVVTDLKEIKEIKDAALFPNPFSSLFHLNTDFPLQNAKIVIRNSLGQTVKELDQLSGHAITISCPELPPGPYTIGIRENGKVTAVKKAVKLD